MTPEPDDRAVVEGGQAALLELGGLLLAGALLGRWFPWADAAAGLAMGLRLFIEGQAVARGTTLAAATSCGGCGSCGCG